MTSAYQDAMTSTSLKALQSISERSSMRAIRLSPAARALRLLKRLAMKKAANPTQTD